LAVLPDDQVLIGSGKYTIVGMSEGKQICARAADDGALQMFDAKELKDCSIVYRADLPASRIYHSKAGTGLHLSVSSRDFVGKRFLPDDIIETPKGVGLVVGVIDANVGIHLITDDGVSFFTPQAIYDAGLFKLKQRRAIVSMFNL
jgi:hypothetical protein